MVALVPILKKSYWALAGLGGLWALLLACSIHPTLQRHLVYMHKIHHGYFQNVMNPEEFGFAKGQVTPFWLDTSDGEKLFCWHVLPLDVYLDNEVEITTTGGEGVADDFSSTLAAKLLKKDAKKTGLITDSISIVSYVLHELKQPSSRIVLFGQSLGTAVTAATALYFTDPDSPHLPSDIVRPAPTFQVPQSFAGVVLAAAFTDLPELLKTYKIKGIVPVLSPLQHYPKIAGFLTSKILDRWATLARLQALLTATTKTSTTLHLTILHARNDQEFTFQIAETVYSPLESIMLAEEGATSVEERRSIHGGERVKRGAFAYRKVETSNGERSVELEVVRSSAVAFSYLSIVMIDYADKLKQFRMNELDFSSGWPQIWTN
ncbi:hypothetical protein N0V90_013393 [Kalmusia sp. IMI 367209]|nr:hypothetical protein N0V90_013393 [Kalmusia sp. IMI 367209]